MPRVNAGIGPVKADAADSVTYRAETRMAHDERAARVIGAVVLRGRSLTRANEVSLARLGP